jgi:ribulose-bisphosphate carboxylase small chain
MWGLPMFDMKDPAAILLEINRCREANPNKYIRVNAYDSTLGRQTTALQYIVQRPENEPGFRLERQEGRDRQIRYTLHPYSLDRPPGERYQK